MADSDAPVLEAPAVGEEVNLTPDGGVRKKILRAGTGKAPPRGSNVTVHYVGKLLTGEEFDSSRGRGEPFSFVLGNGSVIKGWDVGVASMVEGELAVLTCAADYAYGAAGSPPKIPPNATLEFEVELLSFEEVEQLDTAADKLASAQKKKAAGNEAVRAGQFGKAAGLYRKALDTIEYMWDLTPEQTEEQKTLKLQMNLNLALCHLKLSQFSDAVRASTAALSQDPRNVKGLFRRAQAYAKLAEFESAERDLRAALEVDSGNSEVRAELAAVQKAAAQAKTRQKQMYTQMFATLSQ